MNNIAKDTSVKRLGQLAVGNKVRIKPYNVTTMSGLIIEGHMTGQTGYILGFVNSYPWRGYVDKVSVRLYTDENKDTGEFEFAYDASVFPEHIEVLDASEGPVIVGQTCPYSRSELRELFVKQQLDEIERHDFRVEGYKNMATHLAAVYLNQESRFHNQLNALRRKDGTINPRKVEKSFSQLGLQVAPTAFEAPVALSKAEKSRYRTLQDAIARHQAIDWNEVADDFVETV